RRVRTDHRSSAGFPSRAFTSPSASPFWRPFIRTGSVRPRRASRSMSSLVSTACPKKITAGRSASAYTHSPRLAKRTRRSSILATVHACLARAEPRALARAKSRALARAKSRATLIGSYQVLVHGVHVLVGRYDSVDPVAVERDPSERARELLAVTSHH